MKTYHIAMLVAVFFFLPFVKTGGAERLSLPRQEQLSSRRVTQVIQDSEGFLWYATEGGGVCRDDGRRISVFRSDAEHPRLLCSNDVASLAEAAGRYIIIGTYHGANVLDKRDYSIRRLEEVDDKRVDDIVVGRNGHWWLFQPLLPCHVRSSPHQLQQDELKPVGASFAAASRPASGVRPQPPICRIRSSRGGG